MYIHEHASRLGMRRASRALSGKGDHDQSSRLFLLADEIPGRTISPTPAVSRTNSVIALLSLEVDLGKFAHETKSCHISSVNETSPLKQARCGHGLLIGRTSKWAKNRHLVPEARALALQSNPPRLTIMGWFAFQLNNYYPYET